MIYLEPLSWRPQLISYINGEFYPALKEFEKDFEAMIIWIADACIDHVRHVSKELVPTGNSNLIKSLLCWVSMLMHEHCHDEEASKNKHLKHWLIVNNIILILYCFHSTNGIKACTKNKKLF